MPVWATGKAAKVIGLALVVAFAAWLLVTVIGWKDAAKTNAGTVQVQGAKIEATAGITQDGQATAADRAYTDAAASQGREAFRTAIEEAHRREPETASRDSRPIPASVRDAARARRLARERAAGAGE